VIVRFQNAKNDLCGSQPRGIAGMGSGGLDRIKNKFFDSDEAASFRLTVKPFSALFGAPVP
jgi:hypothetical protein